MVTDNMTTVTYTLPSRYVNLQKLSALLQSLFGANHFVIRVSWIGARRVSQSVSKKLMTLIATRQRCDSLFSAKIDAGMDIV